MHSLLFPSILHSVSYCTIFFNVYPLPFITIHPDSPPHTTTSHHTIPLPPILGLFLFPPLQTFWLLFGQTEWDQFIAIFPTVPYSDNTLLFQINKYAFLFAVVPIIHALSVPSESQVLVLSLLTDLHGKPLSAEPHSSLNPCDRTVSVSPMA